MKRARMRGFTIVEVMIVLAVTGALFISAAVAISGRQNQTAFDQAIRQVQSQLQQTINDVAAGQYPNNGDFTCTAGGSQPSITAVAHGQGTNYGCIFLGKVIQFQVQGTVPEAFYTYPIAGLQKNALGDEVTSAKEAGALPITIATAIDKRKMQAGITTAWIKYNGSTIGSVAFMPSLANYSGGNLVSGSQQVNVVPIPGSVLNVSSATATGTIRNELQNDTSLPVDPSTSVQFCFASGTTNQSGLITVGGNGRQLNVTLQIIGDRTC